MHRPSVGCVVVSYNSSAYLQECLPSALRQGVAQVVVWDNASSDSDVSERIAESMGSRVQFVESAVNLGFARAANAAARQLKSCSHLLFLNPDCRIDDPHALEGLLRALDGDLSLAAVVPAVQSPSGEPLVPGGAFPTLLKALLSQLRVDVALGPKRVHAIASLLHRRGVFHSLSSQVLGATGSDLIELEWVSGFCFLIRAEDWASVGGFDERFFLYFEDVALCRALRSRGRRVAKLGDAIVTHDESASSSPKSKNRYFLDAMWVYFREYGSPVQRWAARVRGPHRSRRVIL